MEKKNDLAKIFGVENLITPKTLLNETLREIKRKNPNEVTEDIRALLDELNIRAVSGDIVGICECLDAIDLRMEYLNEVANTLRKASGK